MFEGRRLEFRDGILKVMGLCEQQPPSAANAQLKEEDAVWFLREA